MKNNQKSIFAQNKDFQLFGIGRQDIIKYFFGGNALISILALILITTLLAIEAFYFFPQYQTNLSIYRKSGKEFVDIAESQLKRQKELKSLITQVKQYELYYRAGVDAYIPELYSTMKSVASEQMSSEILAVKIAKKRISEKEFIWGLWEKGKNEEKQAFAKEQKEEFLKNLAQAQELLDQKASTVVNSISLGDFPAQFKQKAFQVNSIDSNALENLRQALLEYFGQYSQTTSIPEYVKNATSEGVRKRTELGAGAFFQKLSGYEKALTASYKPYEKYVDKMRHQTLLVSARTEAFLSAKDRKKAIEEGIPEATEKRKEELKIALERLITEDQDYDKLAEDIYNTLPQHKTLLEEMMIPTRPILANLPDKSELTDKGARRLYDDLMKLATSHEQFMEEQRQKMESWRHDKEVDTFENIGGFFFGNKWVANSSWHNFFGLKPLFGGSLFITLIAISVATPFSIGAAIYVNRLASPKEQALIKPLIEFIQAIPSVVLAFLGVVVVGQTVLKLSYLPFLSWVPGFPASGEQMMLTAGFLLAFMAIPTIFTLAEDAINNVPKAYNEASLALGATPLQTIMSVIVPCSLSGIVAAVILGFGRIIGETMVVLLVAGGTINWPEVWTDPVHTMTGIIAQSTGEAAPGSIQYRALFLVGLVLFFISLTLNFIAQNVIKKFGNKA